MRYEEVRRKREKAGELVERGADAVFVCVLDEMHEEVIKGIVGLGVHVCCEKPLATSLEACLGIYGAWRGEEERRRVNGVGDGERKEPVFGICHVLRYVLYLGCGESANFCVDTRRIICC